MRTIEHLAHDLQQAHTQKLLDVYIRHMQPGNVPRLEIIFSMETRHTRHKLAQYIEQHYNVRAQQIATLILIVERK